MGKLIAQPELHHFSHPHPLQLSNFPHPAASCSCCRLKLSGCSWIYTCSNFCNYFLHIPCSKLPQQITHPFHQAHTLNLLQKPIYPPGFFNCDACGKQGNGFSYHCGICNIDLHTFCSTLPLNLTHQSHHHHLNLTFSPPYQNKAFSCDICMNMGSKEWLYRCNLCEFDAHLVCATTTPIQQSKMQNNYQPPTPTPTTNNNQYQVPGFQYAQAQTNFTTNGTSGVVRTQQKAVSDRQVIQFLLNATIPGLGLLMQGQPSSGGSGGGGVGDGGGGGGVDAYGGGSDSFGCLFSGDSSGMGGTDLGGFGGY